MGRPPIGKAAMTSTERSRRHRAGLATKPATKTPPASDAAKDARIRELAEHCGYLHGLIEEQHRLHKEHHAKWVAYAEKLEAVLKELTTDLAVARKREAGRLRAEIGRRSRGKKDEKTSRAVARGA